MENKNLALAIVLSCLIFIGWQILSMEMGWIKPMEPPKPAQEAAQMDPTSPGSANATSGSADPFSPSPEAQEGFAPQQGRLVSVETPLYKAVFHSGGGILREFYLKNYREDLSPDSPQVNIVSQIAAGRAPMGLLLDGEQTWTSGAWRLEGGDLFLDSGQKDALRFAADIGGMRVVRELAFSGDTYTIDELVTVSSPDTKTIKLAFTFDSTTMPTEKVTSIFSELRYLTFGGQPPVAEYSQYNPTRVAWLEGTKFDEEHAGSDLTAGVLKRGNVSWMAIMNNYFMGAVSMSGGNASAKGTAVDSVFQISIGKVGITVSPGNPAEERCTYFIGPKEASQLNAAPNDLGNALDYGFFSIIAKPLVYLLQFFYGFVHNYGIAIILMTIVIKIVFWPLSQKSYKSMQQMKKLQPMMQKIREKHAGNKDAMNKEIVQLYKTYKVNPAGGCLPILIQIPVFFGLYQALLNAIELRHASFITHLPFTTDTIWLADLSAKDPFFITPLVMGASMFLQQKMTPAPGDPTQARMMMFMPVIFTVLFLNFPAGLVLYWLTNNIISIFQQWLQLRRA